MPLPLPIDPSFRKLCVAFWLDDVDDRLDLGSLEDAEHSWKEASSLYLSLPAGEGDASLEDRLVSQRVKLNQTQIT